MKSSRLLLTAWLTCTFLVVPAVAIELGDPAPPLKIAEWIKGGPVDLKAGQGKNIYVVEFWATWCLPCRASVPHLTELQKKYKDKGVVIVGVSVDQDDARHKTRKDVKPFVEGLGTKMEYVVAHDTEAGDTSKAYMDAVGQKSIPHSFVIDQQGRLVWHGPPDELDPVVAGLVAGTFDLAQAKELMAERKKLNQQREEALKAMEFYFALVAMGAHGDSADKIADKILSMIEKDANALNGFSWKILTEEGLQHRDLDVAMRAARQANELTKGANASILDTLARALFDTGDVKAAIETQRKAVKHAGDAYMRAELEKTLTRYEEAGATASRV